MSAKPLRHEMKGRPACPPLQDYHNRDYVLHLLDDRHFDALNKSGGAWRCATFVAAATGCLDALDNIPAGSMSAAGGNFYGQTMCERGRSLQEILDEYEFMTEVMSDDEKVSRERVNG